MVRKITIDLDDLISQKEAAGIRGCSTQTINSLVKRRKIKAYVIAGKTLVSRKEVTNYIPSKGGRPKKALPPEPAKKISSRRVTRPRKSN
ncbi:MAG: hypothetical protein AABN34_24195 [Acidobacteriota bacterium]